MSARVALAVSIPQTFQDRAVDVGAIRAYLARAEALGFHSAWVVEQVLGSIPSLEPVELLTYAAAVTERLRLGTAVLLTALRSPVHLAKSLATLDHLSGGRLDVGVGLGGNPNIYPAYGFTADRRAARFAEGLALMKRLWTEPRVTFEGEFFRLQNASMEPKPVQKPHPPIWFAAMTPGGIDYACSLAMSVLTTPLRDPFKRVREQAGSFKSSAAKYWGDDHRLKLSMLIMLFVTTSEADAKEKAALAMGRHRRFLNVYTTKGTVERGAIVPMESDISIEDVERNLVIGPPELCIEKLKMYEAEGIDNMQINMNWGTSHRDVMRSLEAFATKVMPHFG